MDDATAEDEDDEAEVEDDENTELVSDCIEAGEHSLLIQWNVWWEVLVIWLNVQQVKMPLESLIVNWSEQSQYMKCGFVRAVDVVYMYNVL